MDIRLYYVDGCPSYLRALKNLNEALATPIETVHVTTTNTDAQTKCLIGPPGRLTGGVVEAYEGVMWGTPRLGRRLCLNRTGNVGDRIC